MASKEVPPAREVEQLLKEGIEREARLLEMLQELKNELRQANAEYIGERSSPYKAGKDFYSWPPKNPFSEQ